MMSNLPLLLLLLATSLRLSLAQRPLPSTEPPPPTPTEYPDPGRFSSSILGRLLTTVTNPYNWFVPTSPLLTNVSLLEDGCYEVTAVDDPQVVSYDLHSPDIEDFLTRSHLDGRPFTPPGTVGFGYTLSNSFSHTELPYVLLRETQIAAAVQQRVHYSGRLARRCYETPDRWNPVLRDALERLPATFDPPRNTAVFAAFFDEYGTHMGIQADRGLRLDMFLFDQQLAQPDSPADTPERAREEVGGAARAYRTAGLEYTYNDPAAEKAWQVCYENATLLREYGVQVYGGMSSDAVFLGSNLLFHISSKTEYENWLRDYNDNFGTMGGEWMSMDEILGYASPSLPDLVQRQAALRAATVHYTRTVIFGIACASIDRWDPVALTCLPPTPFEYLAPNYIRPFFDVDEGQRGEPALMFGTRQSSALPMVEYCMEPYPTSSPNDTTLVRRVYAGLLNDTIERKTRECDGGIGRGEEVFLSWLVFHVKPKDNNPDVLSVRVNGHPLNPDADLVDDLCVSSINPPSGNYDDPPWLTLEIEWMSLCTATVVLHPTLKDRLALRVYDSRNATADWYVRVDPTTHALIIGNDILEHPYAYSFAYEIAPRKYCLQPGDDNVNGEWRGEAPECPMEPVCVEGERLQAATWHPYSYDGRYTGQRCTSGFKSYCMRHATSIYSKVPIILPPIN